MNKPAGTRRVLIAVALAVSAGGAAVMFRHRAAEWSPPERLAAFAEQTRERFNGTPVAPIDDADAVRQVFANARVYTSAETDDAASTGATHAGAVRLTDAQLGAAFETIATFMQLRAGADPERYAAWMRGRGYALKNKQSLLFGHSAFELWTRLHTGRALTAEDTPWTVFRDSFAGELASSRAGRTRPTGVYQDSTSVEIWVGELSIKPDPMYGIYHPFMPVFMARLRDANINGASQNDAAVAYWTDGEDYPGWSFWAPPISIEDLLARDGRVVMMRAHWITRPVGGGTLPSALVMYHDLQTGEWHIPDERAAFSYFDTYDISLQASPPF